MNDTVRFHFRVKNNFPLNITGMTNGFKLYGLYGGEQWTSPVGAWSSAINWSGIFEQKFVNYFSADGWGADTVGFAAFRLIKPGMAPGFDANAFSIATTLDFTGNEGNYICIDTAFYPPSGVWKWTAGGGNNYAPAWYGPYCYEMQRNLVYVSGHAYYLKATPLDTLPAAMRGDRVVLFDVDYIPSLEFDSLGCANADEDGYFDFGPVSNTDLGGSGGQDLFFDIYAENEAAYVTDSADAREFITTLGSPVEDVPSGFFDTTITASQIQSGPFFVADCILDGYRLWTDLRPHPDDDPGGPVQVMLYPFSNTSFYNASADVIHLNSANNPTYFWPDTYDRGVIQHEYGHKLAFTLGFCDDTSGYPPVHEIQDKDNTQTAGIEGFAHWWSCLESDRPVRSDYRNNLSDSGWINLETGEWGLNAQVFASFNARDVDCEGSVAGILWDIYDENPDDYSGLVDYNVLSRPHHPDNVWDSLYDGPENILAVLLDESVLGRRPDNINEFFDIWVAPPSLGNKGKLVDIFYEHGDSTKPCCLGIRGNINGDPEESIDVDDLVYLVDWMFTFGPPPPCLEEADFQADLANDVSDLVYLIDYMFVNGPDPYPCP